MGWENIEDVKELQILLTFWAGTAKREKDRADYYQGELARSHTLLGRVVHQCSERWDSVNLTKYYPTNNLHHKRTCSNPSGEEVKREKS